MEEQIHKTVNSNPDSVSFGSASKGGVIKVYLDFDNIEKCKEKIDKAKEVFEYAKVQLSNDG